MDFQGLKPLAESGSPFGTKPGNPLRDKRQATEL